MSSEAAYRFSRGVHPALAPYGVRMGLDRMAAWAGGQIAADKGRLDFDTTGALLLTNDGELAQRLSHPRYGVIKIYRVKLSACPTEEELARLRKGIYLDDGRAAPGLDLTVTEDA
mgnify:CR=1 FL=1